jgi:hypothetical protein
MISDLDLEIAAEQRRTGIEDESTSPTQRSRERRVSVAPTSRLRSPS